MKLRTNFVGFFLDADDLKKLWILSREHGDNNSKTMRVILREAYQRHIDERSAESATI